MSGMTDIDSRNTNPARATFVLVGVTRAEQVVASVRDDYGWDAGDGWTRWVWRRTL